MLLYFWKLKRSKGNSLTAKEAIQYLELTNGKGKPMTVATFMKNYAPEIGYYQYGPRRINFKKADLEAFEKGDVPLYILALCSS